MNDNPEREYFERLRQENFQVVYLKALQLSRNRSDAEDLTQETFIKAWRFFDHYNRDNPFRNWIFSMLVHTFLDLQRMRRRRASTTDFVTNEVGKDGNLLEQDPVDTAPSPADIIANHWIVDALDNLSKIERELVIFKHIIGLDYAEIARIKGSPIGTIKSRIHRALIKLQEIRSRTST